jgi:predicted cupin superfamily sugar epimerase
MMNKAEYWVQQLSLKPHPEGGFYKEIYRSSISIDKKSLPLGYKDNRRLATSIYYLLRSGEISHFHRLRSDELWYYHFGSSVRIIIIDQEGHKLTKILGPKIEKAEHMQVVIPAGTIFGAEIIDTDSFGLFGCLVAPGFEFDDFEMYSKDDLIQAYPRQVDIIEKFGKV